MNDVEDVEDANFLSVSYKPTVAYTADNLTFRVVITDYRDESIRVTAKTQHTEVAVKHTIVLRSGIFLFYTHLSQRRKSEK